MAPKRKREPSQIPEIEPNHSNMEVDEKFEDMKPEYVEKGQASSSEPLVEERLFGRSHTSLPINEVQLFGGGNEHNVLQNGSHCPEKIAAVIVKNAQQLDIYHSMIQDDALEAWYYEQDEEDHGIDTLNMRDIDRLSKFFMILDQMFFFGSLGNLYTLEITEASENHDSKCLGSLSAVTIAKKCIITVNPSNSALYRKSKESSECIVDSLLHQMVHAMFKTYSCQCDFCSVGIARLGRTAHGPLFQSVIAEINKATNTVLGKMLGPGLVGHIASHVAIGGKLPPEATLREFSAGTSLEINRALVIEEVRLQSKGSSSSKNFTEALKDHDGWGSLCPFDMFEFEAAKYLEQPARAPQRYWHNAVEIAKSLVDWTTYKFPYKSDHYVQGCEALKSLKFMIPSTRDQTTKRRREFSTEWAKKAFDIFDKVLFNNYLGKHTKLSFVYKFKDDDKLPCEPNFVLPSDDTDNDADNEYMSEIVIQSTVPKNANDLRKLLGELLHHMCHAIFDLYACSCSNCHYRPEGEGYGHGEAWQMLAYAVEVKVNKLLNSAKLTQIKLRRQTAVALEIGWAIHFRRILGYDLEAYEIDEYDKKGEYLALEGVKWADKIYEDGSWPENLPVG